jgi:hypothetical protein
MQKLLLSCIVAALTALSTATIVAADKPTPAEKGEKKAAKHIPFHGKVAAIDKDARTLKVGERTFHATDSTKIVKVGKPAQLADAVVGDEVGGAYHLGEGGRMELMSLRIGPKADKEDKKP